MGLERFAIHRTKAFKLEPDLERQGKLRVVARCSCGATSVVRGCAPQVPPLMAARHLRSDGWEVDNEGKEATCPRCLSGRTTVKGTLHHLPAPSARCAFCQGEFQPRSLPAPTYCSPKCRDQAKLARKSERPSATLTSAGAVQPVLTTRPLSALEAVRQQRRGAKLARKSERPTTTLTAAGAVQPALTTRPLSALEAVRQALDAREIPPAPVEPKTPRRQAPPQRPSPKRPPVVEPRAIEPATQPEPETRPDMSPRPWSPTIDSGVQARVEKYLRKNLTIEGYEEHHILLTPQIAQLLLDRIDMEAQRKAMPSHVDFLTLEWRSGRYIYNGDPMKIDTKGRFFDGQHRCRAVIASGVSIVVLLQINHSTRAFESTDVGRVVRTAAQQLHTKTRGNLGFDERTACAAARWVMAFEQAEPGEPPARQKASALSIQVVNSYVIKNAEEFEPAVIWSLGAKQVLRPHPLFCALYIVISRARKTGTRAFFEQLASGEDLQRGNPILTLRNKLISLYSDHMVRPDPVNVAGLVIQAWNAHLAGRTMEKVGAIKRNEDGSIRVFPRIQATKHGYTPEDDE